MSELQGDHAAVRTLQEGDGCYTITIPKNLVRDLGLGPGDGVFFSAQQGDATFTAGRATSILSGQSASDD